MAQYFTIVIDLPENKDYVYDSHCQPSWNLGYGKELLIAVISLQIEL
jgi:hypothetical protein